jgi:hypothetical protein
MERLFEAIDESSIKDGGFIFQAIINCDLRWSIIDGQVSFNQNNIQGWLKQVDVFPDMQFNEGYSTLTYVTLSEVNILKRKFELAGEALKRIINPTYAKEMTGEIVDTETPPPPTEGNLNPENSAEKVDEVLYNSQLTSEKKQSVNDKYFRGTTFDVIFTINGIVLREVSTSGLDSGSPTVTLKLSTGMVDTLDGRPINSWDNFKVSVSSGADTWSVTNQSDPKISEILVYDPVDNVNELIFRTIVPSLLLEFKGDRVKIDNYSNRSSQISVRSNIDFDNLFTIEEATPTEEPIEGEDLEKPLNK